MDGKMKAADLAAGITFWSGLLVGVLCFALTWNIVRSDDYFKKNEIRSRVGCFAFFQTKEGKIADGILLLSIAGNVVQFFVDHVPTLLSVIFIFMFLLTFYLHFVLNGRVFRYLIKQ